MLFSFTGVPSAPIFIPGASRVTSFCGSADKAISISFMIE
jgi:hypothetical protein